MSAILCKFVGCKLNTSSDSVSKQVMVDVRFLACISFSAQPNILTCAGIFKHRRAEVERSSVCFNDANHLLFRSNELLHAVDLPWRVRLWLFSSMYKRRAEIISSPFAV